MPAPTSRLRDLPGVDDVLRHAAGAALVERHGRAEAAEAIRAAVSGLRDALRSGAEADVSFAISHRATRKCPRCTVLRRMSH